MRTDLVPPEAVHADEFTFDDWLAASDRLASALGAKPLTATNSGHNIYQYEPALVTDAVREVVDEVRAGQAG